MPIDIATTLSGLLISTAEWLSKKKLQALTSSNAVLAREVQDLKSQLNDARRSDWHRTQRFLETLKTNITSKIDSLVSSVGGDW